MIENNTVYNAITISHRKSNGEEYTALRKEMADHGIGQEEIDEICRDADKLLFMNQSRPSRAPENHFNKIAGLLLIAFGVGVTLYTYFNDDLFSNSYVVLYGPVLAGIGIWFSARKSPSRFKRKWG